MNVKSKLSKEEPSSNWRKVRIAPDLYDQVAQIADDRRHDGVTHTGIVNDAVREYLGKYGSKGIPKEITAANPLGGKTPPAKEVHRSLDKVLNAYPPDVVRGLTHLLLSMSSTAASE